MAYLILPTHSIAQQIFVNDTDVVGGPFHVGETWGASWGDVNGDLFPDLFAGNHGDLNSILRNNGDGTFSEIVDQVDSERIWVDEPNADIHGGSWADFDNDGDQDLFVTRSSIGARFQAMENLGLGGFTEESGRLRVGPFGGGRLPIFFDYTGDGFLDIALARFGGTGLALFRWDAALDEYVEESDVAGIENQCTNNSFGLVSDLFNNGKLHYLCSREQGVPQRVYDTSTIPFTDVSTSVDSTGTNADAVLVDLNNDLRIDLFATRGVVRPSGAGRVSSERIEAWLTGGGQSNFEKSMTFRADGPITVNSFARSVGVASAYRIGANEIVPSELPVTLDPNDTDTHGLSENRDERAIFIGYDPASEQWTIAGTGGGVPGASFFFGTYITVDGVNLSEPVVTGQTGVELPQQPRMLINDGQRLVNSGSGGIGAIQCGGIAAADFDNDMDVDLYLACRTSIENTANRLYLNDGDGNFTLATNHGGEGILGVGIDGRAGTAGVPTAADYNVDGFMDLHVTNGNRLFPLISANGFSGGGPGEFFRNTANNGNHWLQFDLRGIASNRDGFGAKVIVTAGGVSQLREQNGMYHRWSHDSRRIHFGLGSNTVADVRVEWPDGTVDEFTSVAADQLYEAAQGAAQLTALTPAVNAPSLSITGDNVQEGDLAIATVSVFPPSANSITVDYQTVQRNQALDTNATNDVDFTQIQSSTLTFAPFETEKTISVETIADVDNESNENFWINLSNPTNAALNQPEGLIVIRDDDDAQANAPLVSVSDADPVLEGDLAEFTISLSEVSTQTITVEFATLDGSAVADDDFEPRDARVTFQPGQVSAIRRVTTLQDGNVESAENFGLRLFSPSNANILNSTAVGSILDSDTVVPQISISSESVTEGEGVDLTISLSEATTEVISVDFVTVDGTAIAGSDYSAVGGTVEFLPGELSTTITLTTLQDSQQEGSESLDVVLSNVARATIGNGIAQVTILDDEPPLPAISIDSASVAEGAPALLTVSLSEPTSLPVVVTFAAVDGSAVAPADYTDISGTLTFAAGETIQTISLQTVADIEDETDETFTVSLTNPTGGQLLQSIGTVTVVDDDDAPLNGPVVSIVGSSAQEGDQVEFVFSLSEASSNTVRVDFGTVEGSAEDDLDFVPRPIGRVTFQPGGSLTQTRRITTLQDGLVESTETFTMALSNAENANILNTSALGTILDIDTFVPPQINVNNASVNEGDSTSVEISLSAAVTETVRVNVVSSDGSATAGTDYLAVNQTVEFLPGDVVQTIIVNSLQDNDVESDETLNITLSAPVNGVLGDASGVVTIVDDEIAGAPTVSITGGSVQEGGQLEFVISLSEPSSSTVRVDFGTVAESAEDDLDFIPRPIGRVTFQPGGSLSQTRRVTTLEDNLVEPAETFSMVLSNADNANILNASAQGTILDIGAVVPQISIASVTVTEGGSADLVVTLSEASNDTVTVNVASSNITALAGTDYTPINQVVEFSPGVLSQTISLSTLQDDDVEGNETLNVALSSPVNGTLNQANAVVTIQDDDNSGVFVSVSGGSVQEGGQIEFVFTLSQPTANTVRVDFGTVSGTADANSDFIPRPIGRVTFQPGGTLTQIRRVTTVADGVAEPNETFTMQLSNPVNASILDAVATGTIIDAGAAGSPQLSITGGSALEGGRVEFVVSLSEPSTTTVRVDFGTVSGTADENLDFIPRPIGRVTFQPGGSLTQIRRITTLADTIIESSETFTMELSNAINANIQTSTATGTILDNN